MKPHALGGAIPVVRDAANAWRWGGFALLGAATLLALEMLNLPPGMSITDRAEVVRSISVQWTACAAGIAALASWCEPRLRGWQSALLYVAFALAACLVLLGLRLALDALGLHVGNSVYAGRAPVVPTFFYNLWVLLVFGALFMTACLIGMRRQRLRRAGAEARIARDHAEAQLAEVQARRLVAQVDPATLLAVASEIQRRYASDAAAADQLLQRLVSYLRVAMPSVRANRAGDVAALDAAWRALQEDLFSTPHDLSAGRSAA